MMRHDANRRRRRAGAELRHAASPALTEHGSWPYGSAGSAASTEPGPGCTDIASTALSS